MLKRNAAFAALCAGFFILMMDTTSVPLLYTTLIDRFEVGPVQVAWVQNIYLLTFAAVMFLGGRLGDQVNRKPVVLTALALIGFGALCAGSDRAMADLITGRAVMGAGAGLLAPQSMAYVSVLFKRGGRGTAFGIWGAIAGLATAAGPILTQSALALGDWRWVMWANVPLAALAFATVLAFLPGVPGHGLDMRKALNSVAVGLALGTLTLGLQIFSEPSSWEMSGGALAVLGALSLGVFAYRDTALGAALILPPDVWQDRGYLRVCMVSGLLGLGLTAFYLPLSYLVDARFGLGPVLTAALIVTIALTNAIIGPFAGHLSDRRQPESIVQLGLATFAAACLGLALIGVALDDTAAVIAMFACLVLVGVGTGLAFAPLANLALSSVGESNVGRAAAFYNAVRQGLSALGGVLVAALFGVILRSHLGVSTDDSAQVLRSHPHAVALACTSCFIAIAVSLGAGAVLSHPRA